MCLLKKKKQPKKTGLFKLSVAYFITFLGSFQLFLEGGESKMGGRASRKNLLGLRGKKRKKNFVT